MAALYANDARAFLREHRTGNTEHGTRNAGHAPPWVCLVTPPRERPRAVAGRVVIDGERSRREPEDDVHRARRYDALHRDLVAREHVRRIHGPEAPHETSEDRTGRTCDRSHGTESVNARGRDGKDRGAMGPFAWLERVATSPHV